MSWYKRYKEAARYGPAGLWDVEKKVRIPEAEGVPGFGTAAEPVSIPGFDPDSSFDADEEFESELQDIRQTKRRLQTEIRRRIGQNRKELIDLDEAKKQELKQDKPSKRRLRDLEGKIRYLSMTNKELFSRLHALKTRPALGES